MKENSVNHVRILHAISEMILQKGNVSDTATAILDLISKSISSLFYVFFLIDEDKNLVLHSYTTEKAKTIGKYVKFDVKKIKYPLSVKECLITRCVNEDRIVQSERLRNFFSPVFKPAVILDLIQRAIKIKLCVGIPIKVEGKIIGAISFGSAQKNLTEEQLSLLQLYANLAGIAIHNSLQFQKIQHLYMLEKEVTSLLSHELKTPISIAHNSAQLLKLYVDRKKEDLGSHAPQILRHEKDMKQSIERLSQICASIFSLRETDTQDIAKIHKLNLSRQLEQVLQMFKSKAESKGLNFSATLKLEEGTFYGGGVQLEQVLVILLDNALKYTTKGFIDLKLVQKGTRLRCEVTDSGPGIPPSKRKQVFERFYRHRTLANRNLHKIEGLGLGLYIAKNIVEKLDGSIAVQDNPAGRGSKFVVELPLYLGARKQRGLRKNLGVAA